METQKASVKKVALPYGTILGLISIVISVIVYVMDLTYERPWWQGLIGFIVMILCIVYGLKAFKKDNAGFLSLGEALKVGLAIALIASIFGVLFNLVFMYVIEPDFAAQSLLVAEEQMLEQNPNMTEEQLEFGLSITETMTSPLILSALSIIMSLFFGFIVALVAGLVMKVNRPAHI